jgi:hypothetical protein
MRQVITHMRSSVVVDGSPKLPTSEQIDYGEIAINFADGHETISMKNNANEIVEIKTKEYYEKIIPTSSTVEDWGFQFTMTPEGSRILVTPHKFVSEGAIAFAGQELDEEFEHRVVLITEEEYNALVESGQVNETKIYYVY